MWKNFDKGTEPGEAEFLLSDMYVFAFCYFAELMDLHTAPGLSAGSEVTCQSRVSKRDWQKCFAHGS